ncbi:MAG: CpsD/CapB family tyrosine-protein kinase [Syntrophorhabdaceae bacterium]|nr:CpsD/CapB family tyrosine-protein kinase [Syntrophorhabdaceae bacterium]
MQNNGNGINKINEAIKKAAEEKGKALQSGPARYADNPPPGEKSVSYAPPAMHAHAAVSTGISKKIVVFHNPSSPISEQFRVISTHIFCPEREGKLKAVVITSSSNEEGKSVAAINLAIVTAQISGKPTLLIDCNFRKPSIGSLMGISSEKGFGDLLSGKSEAFDVTAASEINNLSMMPAGHVYGNPTELLNSQKIKDVLFELKSKYHRIILDTPAVIPFADPRILSHIVDGTVLVVRAGKTRREVVARAEAVLKSVGANILGYVITDIEYHIPEYIHRHL